MIRFLTFRNRKKPKSSKQKISAFFILTKLPLLLFSISHSSRFPFLLTPIPPLLPIFPFFTPTPPTPPHFLLSFSPTPLTSSHSPLSFASPHPIFSHAPFSLFQYAPFLHISHPLYSNSPHSPSFPIPPHFSFSSKSNHVHSPKIPLLQNPKPENPFVLSQCSTPFAEPSSSFPLQKK